MANQLGQPTVQEIAEKYCTEMLCNALLCEGCPVYAAVQQTVVAYSSVCPSCGHIDGYHPPECMAGE
jgi:hypothetical protein